MLIDRKASPSNPAPLKVAIVHHWFVTLRGAERVIKSLLRLFPRADIYTLFFDESVCGSLLAGHRVFTSALDTRYLRPHYQKLFPLYPLGIGSLRLRGQYDLILSSESGPAKGIANSCGAPHLCYINTPMRYCWGFTQDYLRAMPRPVWPAARLAFAALRRWDLKTVDNVDRYVANSKNVRDRVRRFYGRDAAVVPSPIPLDLFSAENLVQVPPRDRVYYLSFGAITPYKNIGLLVDVFNSNGRELVIVGEGSERRRLMARAKPNIRFTGALPWGEVRRYILGAKALLFPGEEDFGLVPLEVMAHGVPVIALGRGGALETVIEDRELPLESSGLFFHEASRAGLQNAIDSFEQIADHFDPLWIQSHVRQFGEDIFLQRMEEEIVTLLNSRIRNRDRTSI